MDGLGDAEGDDMAVLDWFETECEAALAMNRTAEQSYLVW